MQSAAAASERQPNRVGGANRAGGALSVPMPKLGATGSTGEPS